MTDDLVTWIKAQLDAEYDLASRLAERYRRPDDGQPYWPLPSIERNWNFRPEEREHDPDIAAGLDLIKAYNPHRVMAEIDAKRHILDECDSMINGWTHEETKDFGKGILRLLALPMAGREGYRSEWAP